MACMMATYGPPRGHPKKLYKERSCLNIRANSFSNSHKHVEQSSLTCNNGTLPKRIYESIECLLEETPPQILPCIL